MREAPRQHRIGVGDLIEEPALLSAPVMVGVSNGTGTPLLRQRCPRGV
jgi:hypothetical protein